jgi:molecular chaperone DnaK (HSP70)
MSRGDARFVVGIDLGTTNSSLAYVDTAEGPAVKMLELPQLVAPGTVAGRPLLPSFLYLASAAEFPKGALDLPWGGQPFAVGELARAHGWQVPMRLVSSAKSWLSHAGVDRTAAILPPLPPGAEAVDVERVSPVEVSARYLRHLRSAWDHLMARGDESARLAAQDVYLTVPASFDAAARELTVRAATAAGLEVTLLEEPQAAFYSWLGHHGEKWRKLLNVGDVVLVCDVGGGTTDFSLISVNDEGGQLALSRIAVGDHILLGGDNMDLALSATVAARLADEGTKLDAWQSRSLTHACRAAKESLLSDGDLQKAPVAVLGRGRSLVGGTIQSELQRSDVQSLILDGFFPSCGAGDLPRTKKRTGLQELGLPFAADPAVTRHLAKFIGSHKSASAILFNGGVMKSPPLRRRIVETLDSWSDDPENDLLVLDGTDFDLAVAHGAAYYGLVRRGKGVRIRGGTARTYYIGVESSMPAVPGMEPPLKAICVAPRGMEEGTDAEVAGEELGLVVGEPAEFRFLSSTTRADPVGAVVEDRDGIDDTAPMEIDLPPSPTGQKGQLVPVRLSARVTEVGTLEVWCVARDGARWKLEYDLRGDEQRR